MQKAIGYAKILPITSIRFLAALYVVLYHLSGQVSVLHQPDFLGRFLRLGYMSVSFFFFLSGFVLSIAYLNSPLRKTFREFFIARIARIYPLLLACLLLDLPHFLYVQVRQQHTDLSHLAASLFVSFAALEAWFGRIPALDPPSWSIAAEFFFYLLFPFFGGIIWRLSTRATWLLAALLYLCGVGLIVLIMPLHPDFFRFSYNPVTHLYEFLLGICLAKLYVALPKTKWSERLTQSAPLLATVSLLLFLAIPFFSLAVPDQLLQHGLLLPLYALVLLAFSSGNRILAVLFSHPWLVILGDASFALYLVHIPLASLMRKLMSNHPTYGPILYVGTAIFLSVLSFFYLEIPARRWIMSRARTKGQENAVVRNLAQ